MFPEILERMVPVEFEMRIPPPFLAELLVNEPPQTSIQDDGDLIALLRHMERNPIRARLAERAEDWRWSSAYAVRSVGPTLELGQLRRPADWRAYVNEPQTEMELAAVRLCLARGRPFGNDSWTMATATSLGLESSLRKIGRPRKETAGTALFDEMADREM